MELQGCRLTVLFYDDCRFSMMTYQADRMVKSIIATLLPF